MGKYAQGTEVRPEKSKMEIERILTRYGATSFASGWQGKTAVIVFESHQRRIKFVLPIPDPKEEKETRRRWRCLVLAIKAKLEVVESGIASFEEEFMAHIVLPNGLTVGEAMTPQIESSYADGKMPPLLTSGAKP